MDKLLIPQNLALIILLFGYLSLIILLLRRENTSSRLFGATVITLSLWILSILLLNISSSKEEILFFSRSSFIGPIILIPTFLLFSWYFPKKTIHLRKSIIIVVSLTACFFLIATFTPYVIQDVTIKVGEGVSLTYQLGTLYFFQFIFLAFSLLYSFFILYKKYKKSKGLEKLQIRYLFLGTVITAVLTLSTNVILPIFNFSSLAGFGPLSTLFLLFFISYAIIRHRLLDIRLVITRSLIYFFLILFVAGSFTGITLLAKLLFEEFVGEITATILVSLIIVIGFEPLKRWVSRSTDSVFYKAKIDYADVLREISEIINREIVLDPLVTSISATLESRLKLKHAGIALKSAKGDFVEYINHDHFDPKTFSSRSGMIGFLRFTSRITILESLERKIQDTSEGDELKELKRSREEMETNHIALAAPIVAQGKFNAVLILGPKLSGDSFSTEELKMIETLTPQIGSAIEKSMLFEEVKNFSSQLKVKVDEATKELKERNRFLGALQDITSTITHSLDYKKVGQDIVDGVAKKLGYIGAVLLLYDPKTGQSWAEAITQTPVTRAAMKLLPKPVNEYHGHVDENSMTDQVILTGEMRESDSLAEFLAPAVPKAFCFAMQKLIRAKYIVAVPIYAEGEILGALVFVLGKKKEEISSQERAMMIALGDQAGIVLHNIKLFDRIQDTNKQLEQANEHLKQLDQAKSEFVSIASHQLRTPMTGIMGYLSMMVQGDFGKMEPEHTKLLTELLSESQRMIRLINLFLNVSKIESGKMTINKQPTQIKDLIDQQIKDQKKPAEDKGLVLKVEVDKELPIIEADGDKLMNVVQNLIDNAIKYTERGSVTVRAFQTDGHIQVEIQDTGVGIKREDVHELFGKFVRGSGIAQINPDGSGLGLFIAKSIVEMHGGKIWVESEGEGKGTKFAFTIPITQPKK
ncbi:MAG: hypothetical protein H6760_01335 [Candidatus Nomurabacteria bacterium]|nr:MAG: hypothetical protein H6760_01335 [Candidatus Nomurabacteria bacterium]